MKKNNIPRTIGIFISLSGLTVMAGWFLGAESLKSILPVWVSMKFSTALSFFLSGIILFLIAQFQKGDRETPMIILPILSMVILLLMGSLLASTITGVSVGVEEMFVRDSMTAIKSVTPGRPSIITMLDLILIGILGILTVMDIKRLNKTQDVFGMILITTGTIAILGYIMNRPTFYFAFPGLCSAMALHTAVLFFFWGMGFLFTRENK